MSILDDPVELIDFSLPVSKSSSIKVIGVGGGGGNAVNNMFNEGIKDVEFVICNTDAQALEYSPIPEKIHLGQTLTEGRGAGNKPAIGEQAAIESMDQINQVLSPNIKMVFITAGMGGGTGTGAAPVIARAAKEKDILSVGIVSLPFLFEGERRVKQALEGLSNLKKYVDSVIVISNEKLKEHYGDLKLSEAFKKADDILTVAAKGIAEIITQVGYINVDFEDVKSVMQNSGVSLMGSGMASGDDRAIHAIQDAVNSPLLNKDNLKGAKNVLINLMSGDEEFTLEEIITITDFIQENVGNEANINWGTGTDLKLGDKISIVIIATGFDMHSIPKLAKNKQAYRDVVTLTENNLPYQEDEVIVAPTKRKVEKPREEFYDDSEKSAKQTSLFLEMEEEEERVIVAPGKRKPSESANKQSMGNKLREFNYHKRMEQDSIDYMEKTPAYQRNKTKLDDLVKEEGKEISNLSISQDDDENIRNNSFLHDNID